MILENGSCQLCPDHEILEENKIECKRPDCGELKITIDGICEACPENEVLLES